MSGRRRSTPVRIPEEARRRLEELKNELGLDSLGDVLNLLVGDAVGGVVTAVLDMRRDVKELVSAVKGLREELSRLNSLLERALESLKCMGVDVELLEKRD